MMRFASQTGFCFIALFLILPLASVTADDLALKYYALCPGQELHYFTSLPPEEEKGRLLRTADGGLAMQEFLGSASIHPDGGIEVIRYSQPDGIQQLERLASDGRVLSSIQIAKVGGPEIFGQGLTCFFATTSHNQVWLARVNSSKGPSGSRAYTLDILKLANGKVDAQHAPISFEVFVGTSGYVHTPIAWDPDKPVLYYTEPTEEVYRIDPESGGRVKIVDGAFYGLVPQSDQIAVRYARKDLALYDRATRTKRPIKIPTKLQKENFYDIYPLPGGRRILYVTPRFFFLVEDATNLWVANVDGTELEKVGKSRNYLRDFRFVQ